MNTRKPEVQAAYEHFKLTYQGACPFCDVTERKPQQLVEQHGAIRVLQNDFPYGVWDNFEVGSHLMITPVRHIGSFADFDESETSDFFEILKKYESDHYSVYSRAPSNTSRSQSHLHTHLIKPVGY